MLALRSLNPTVKPNSLLKVVYHSVHCLLHLHILEIMPINGKKIHKIVVFLDSNVSFTIRVFTWGLANDLHICKNYEKPIIPSNLI